MVALARRALGSTGIEVSCIGLGTVKLGRNTDVKYPNPFELPDDQSVTELLAHAANLGINLIDTAPAYGDSEARLGRLLPGPREQWVVCTKAGERYDGGRSTFDFTPAGVRASVQTSLRRLATDYLDVVLIHSNGEDADILQRAGTLEALAAEKRSGNVRAVGISVKSATGIELAVAAGADVVMATASVDYQDELSAIAAAGARGCGVLIKKALASGHLAADSLRFVLEQPGVSSAVVGTIDPTHLAANVAAVTG